MKDKLDQLAECVHLYELLNFRYSKDINHDYQLLDWFADGGEIRAFKDYKIKNAPWRFNIIFVKKELKLHLGIVSSDFKEVLNNSNILVKLRYDYLKYFRQKNKNLSYCTNNLLKTCKEIQTDKNVIKYTDNTIYYSDGSFSLNNIFKYSKDTVKTYEKSETYLINLLNQIEKEL